MRRRKLSQRSSDILWTEYFRDPSQWWDNRQIKGSPLQPDFKHRVSKESLWITDWYNPFWVCEELRRRGLTSGIPAHDGDPCEDHKLVHGNDDGTSFVAQLRACTKNKDLSKGTRVHDDIVKRGLLKRCSDDLITMYAKCGALEKAKELLYIHGSRDVISWTALIAGYAQKGQGQMALACYEQMKHEGLSPDAVTFACLLKACGSIKEAEKGEQLHEEIAGKGFLENDIVLGIALVDMYAKCGNFTKAQQALEQLPGRKIAAWNALITGYVQEGQGEQALNCFEQMQREGFSPNAVTFTCILKACGSIGAGHKGKEIHDEISRQGLLRHDIVLGNALVDMYAKCGAPEKAQVVLKELPIRDVVTWSSLIAGYAQQGQGEQALNCYKQMRSEGLSPNAVTYASLLVACGSIGAADKGEQIHDEISRQGLVRHDPVLGNALVDMYAKCAALSKAQRVLEDLPARDIASWNVLIGGYAQEGLGERALNCYHQMQHDGLSPNATTFASILKACGSVRALDTGEQIHEEIAKQGLLGNDIVLGNALVDMYSKCGHLLKAQKVLDDLPVRDVVSWNALITGYVQEGHGEKAVRCFKQMQHDGITPDAVTFLCILKACGGIQAVDMGEQIHNNVVRCNDSVLSTAVVDMYAKCGAMEKAQKLLKELPIQDVVAWSALMDGFTELGEGEEALKCFEQMEHEGIGPERVTFLCILKACGSVGALQKGEQIHHEIIRRGLLDDDAPLGNCLVDMYAKCGALSKAELMLEELPARDFVTWNALIAGYAQDGRGIDALTCLKRMQCEGLSPDEATFSCILKACGSVGAIDKGEQVHDEIANRGLLGDDVVLGNSLVDMYAKCGALIQAQQVHEELPVQDVTAWGALLDACRKWGDVVVGRRAFEWAVQIDKTDAAA